MIQWCSPGCMKNEGWLLKNLNIPSNFKSYLSHIHGSNRGPWAHLLSPESSDNPLELLQPYQGIPRYSVFPDSKIGPHFWSRKADRRVYLFSTQVFIPLQHVAQHVASKKKECSATAMDAMETVKLELPAAAFDLLTFTAVTEKFSCQEPQVESFHAENKVSMCK